MQEELLYFEMQANPRELYFGERLKNFAYNCKYKAVGLLQQYRLESALTGYQTAHLLGKKYECNPAKVKQINQQFAKAFREIIWITYRSGFPELLKECGEDSSFVTDTGWGCMIRVGQMLFAEILRSHLHPRTNQDFDSICCNFNDFQEEALFSIQRIARLGKKEFNLSPGQWYNPAQIAYILSNFLNQAKQSQLSNLKSVVFNNAALFFDQMIEAFDPTKTRVEECMHKEAGLICEKCWTSNRSVAVIILVRIGLDCPQKEYLDPLDEMTTWPWFRGMLGGKPEKALYLVGSQDSDYIYLDPHYVQQARKQNTVNNSYSCDSFRKCHNTAIDPSLGVCFYLSSLFELNRFYYAMMEAKQKEGFFIYVANETPAYVRKEQVLDQKSGEFEII